LDEKDRGRVQGLSVELMEGAESLFDEIDGPRSFQPTWVVDALVGARTIVTFANKGFDGNWLSIIIRFGRRAESICSFLWRPAR
jgi:hypothetical protein